MQSGIKGICNTYTPSWSTLFIVLVLQPRPIWLGDRLAVEYRTECHKA
jgi:hypothetical protein